ncbi:hypothetical protein [Lysobacter gummosus]|uniref:hypothetical protein n=1 Tax=Lysobacter gummosus TaxID=262324 RepID=UPI00362FAA1C
MRANQEFRRPVFMVRRLLPSLLKMPVRRSQRRGARCPPPIRSRRSRSCVRSPGSC